MELAIARGLDDPAKSFLKENAGERKMKPRVAQSSSRTARGKAARMEVYDEPGHLIRRADLAVRLEERGLVRRMMPMKSRRFRLLHLTPQGTNLLKKLVPSSLLLARRLLKALDKDEQRVFLDLLKKFVHLNNEESRAPLDRGLALSRNNHSRSRGR